MKEEEAQYLNPPRAGWVRIFHPSLKDSVTDVTERAFKEVHEPKGWKKWSKAGDQPRTTASASSEKEGK